MVGGHQHASYRRRPFSGHQQYDKLLNFLSVATCLLSRLTAHMKTSTRRLLGAVLLGFSIVCPFALTVSGAWSRVLDSHTETHGSTTATSVIVESHWPRGIGAGFLCVAGVGLLLLLWPRREKTNA